MVQQFLSRPGVQSSEFKIAAMVTAWLGLNADQHWVAFTNALIIALPSITYVVSRGLAKTETRSDQSAAGS